MLTYKCPCCSNIVSELSDFCPCCGFRTEFAFFVDKKNYKYIEEKCRAPRYESATFFETQSINCFNFKVEVFPSANDKGAFCLICEYVHSVDLSDIYSPLENPLVLSFEFGFENWYKDITEIDPLKTKGKINFRKFNYDVVTEIANAIGKDSTYTLLLVRKDDKYSLLVCLDDEETNEEIPIESLYIGKNIAQYEPFEMFNKIDKKSKSLIKIFNE